MNEADERTRKPLSLTPKHLVGRMYIGGYEMRWSPPKPGEVEGPCPWSWLAAVPTDQAVTQ